MRGVLAFGRSILLATTLVGCGGSSTAPEPANFEGQYVLSGTIDGFPDSDITGTISITGQSGEGATVVQTIIFRDSGQSLFTISPEIPPTAQLSDDGSISWSFSAQTNPPSALGEGDRFLASGRLQGNTIDGTWSLTGTLPLAGSFSATR